MLASTMTLNSQKITGVKYSLFEKTANDYWLRITPNLFDGYASETAETSRVYAVMMHYMYKGSGKSVYQDVTSKFINGEDYLYAFSYGTYSLDKLKAKNVTFF
jgi:hypothetical protein